MIHNTHARISLLALSSLSVCLASCAQTGTKPSTQSTNDSIIVEDQPSWFRTHEFESLENVHQLSDQLYSGSGPQDRKAFEELASLGIRTLISVDAIPPESSIAGEYNIRVIHLPLGYNGINEQRVKELAFAIQSSFKPVYVHCHHGKHRGPAAICAGAIALGMIDQREAHKFMIQAGTSENYPKLWESVQQTTELDEIEPMRLTKRVRVGTLGETMSSIGDQFDSLWKIAENDFAPLEDHPDRSAISSVSQIHNLLRSLEKSRALKNKSPYFKEDLENAIIAASKLENVLRNNQMDQALSALENLEFTCVDCHSEHAD